MLPCTIMWTKEPPFQAITWLGLGCASDQPPDSVATTSVGSEESAFEKQGRQTGSPGIWWNQDQAGGSVPNYSNWKTHEAIAALLLSRFPLQPLGFWKSSQLVPTWVWPTNLNPRGKKYPQTIFRTSAESDFPGWAARGSWMASIPSSPAKAPTPCSKRPSSANGKHFCCLEITPEKVGQSPNGPPAWLTEYWSKYSVGNAEAVGTNGNLMGNQGNLGNFVNLVGAGEGTESRQNYWAPSFGNWPTHTVSKSSIYPAHHLFSIPRIR